MSEQCGACLKCHARYVCADHVRLYGQECMRYLRSIESYGKYAAQADAHPDTVQQAKPAIAEQAAAFVSSVGASGSYVQFLNQFVEYVRQQQA